MAFGYSLRLSYTKLTSWVFNNKPNRLKPRSFRRKSSKKKGTINKSNENTLQPSNEDKPKICVSECERIDEESNKLFDLIEGKFETNASEERPNPKENRMVLMYLTPPSDTQNECLVYSYPKSEAEEANNPVLLKLKGMFVTLNQVVFQITNQSINISSIAVNEDNREQIYKIGFVSEFESLFLLAVPYNQFTDIEVEAIVKTIERVIKFLYNSMDNAFKETSNHLNLSKLFSILDFLLTEDNKYSSNDSIFFDTIKRLLIDDDLAINLNDSLSEYEAMDWLSDDSSFDIHQQNSCQYVVIGSCLIYKGFLLTSHLPNNHMKDIYSFLSLKGLLCLHKSHSLRLVLWREVFPLRDRSSVSNDWNGTEVTKYFISIVGFGHIVHCTLLEMPFNSCEQIIYKANEVIINESIRLLKSHFIKTGLSAEIDHCFDVQLMSAKLLLDRKNEQKRYKSLSSLKELLSIASTSSSKQALYRSTGSLSSLDNSSVCSSVKSHSSPSLQHSLLSRTSSSCTSLSHSHSKDMNLLTCSPNNCVYMRHNLKLPENLVCYLEIEDGQQIFAGPLLQWPKDICQQVFKKFARCCYAMSQRLRASCDPCLETGTTFQIKVESNFLSPNKLKAKKSANEVFLFNVIGRHDRNLEFYACFKTDGCDLVPNDFDIEDFIYSLKLQRRLI